VAYFIAGFYTYLARRRAEGKTWREAIRALKRYLVRAIWRRWQQCLGEQMQQAAATTEPT
jgi:hypothetical protein